MFIRFLGVFATLWLMASVSPAHAVRADAQQCYPDGFCTTCVEYSGGVCTKCMRNPRCMRGARPMRCRYPGSRHRPECQKPRDYFNTDGTVDRSPDSRRRWPGRPYTRYRR